ncbi:MAG: diacylglycerol kinase family lipid kinase [Chloroflexi bacterium]|nr:diacylglycerol kinase family lipid kinase [Chloroflexota bacterium]
MLPDHLQRGLILVNPRARGIVARRFDAEAALRYVRRRGVEARLVVASSVDEMSAEARKAAAGGDGVVFVAGGDGALRLVARELAGSGTVLAAIPGGTANVWGREAGIPTGFRAAFDAHLSGQAVEMDLGAAGDEVFLLMASIGWDAAIAGRVSLALKRRMGPLAYVVEAARMLPSLRPAPARWSVSGGVAPERAYERPLAVMLVGNTRLYGGVVEIADQASARDGLLDLYALCPERPGDGARLAWKTVRHALAGDRAAVVDRGSGVSFETPGFPIQLDGDTVGETPVRLTVRPRALRVSVPAGPLPAVLP